MSSGIEIRAPAEQTEGTRSQILRWLKQVGDSVAENESGARWNLNGNCEFSARICDA